MAISTRMSRNPVTPSAQSPSIGARPSNSRPSSVKNSMAASMSSTTMPTLSIRLTVMMSPWRLTAGISRPRTRAFHTSPGADYPEGENDDADPLHGRLDWARLLESLTVGHNTHQRPGRGCAGALAKLLPAGRYLVARL